MLALERKALLVLKQVNQAQIARDLECSRSDVSRVVLGQNVFETPLTKRIKDAVAKAVSLPIAELWPDEPSAVEPDTGKPGATSGRGSPE